MALEYIRDILKSGLKDNPQNKLFGKILSAIDNAGKLPTVSELWAKLPAEDETGVSPQDEDPDKSQEKEKRDLRIQLATFGNFRKFPDFGKDGLKFGIPFFKMKKKGMCQLFNRVHLRDQEPLSAVLLGANGVGKTSVYSAMEAVAYGYSYIAEAHGYKSTEDQKKYFCHGAGDKEPEATLCTKCQDMTYPALQKDILQPAFFCSEYDIYVIQQNQITSLYLFNQLGKGDLIELHAKLTKIIPLFGIISDIKKLKEAEKTPGISMEKRNSLEKQLKYKKAEGRRFLEVDKWLTNYEIPVTQQHQAELKSVLDYLQLEIDRILTELRPIAEKFLSALLAPYIKEDDGKIVVKKEHNTVTINIEFTKSDGTTFPLEPRQYFNTFRIKVFAVALKIALSCCIKIQNKINFPIILDDTFDASDFNTKHKIREFIYTLINQYNTSDENTSEELKVLKELRQYPLQLIFFTQDDLVAENAYLGFIDANSDVIYGRIFDYNLCKKDDVISFKDGDTTIEFARIIDNIE